MSQIFWIDVSRVRRSSYNPRIVQDPEKTSMLKTSIAREGIKQPLMLYEAGDGFYEVLDGWRRVSAAAELGFEKVPCIVLPPTDIAKQSLTIHFSQDDLTPEEVVLMVERVVAEEVFKSVEEVCRYLGVSKSWFYALKRAAKYAGRGEGLPASTLSLIETAAVEDGKKKELVELLRDKSLPRSVVKEVLEEVVNNPGDVAAIVERHLLSMPRHIDDNYVQAVGLNTYILRRGVNYAEFTSQNSSQILWTVKIPLQDIRVVKRLWQKF